MFRVRSLPTPILAEAMVAKVLTDFLPQFRDKPGYAGYLLAFDLDNPAGHVPLALTADAAAAEGHASVSADFVETLDPRFTPELVDQIDGPVRTLAMTTRTVAGLPPNLAGGLVTMRSRDSLEGLDMERVISQVEDSLVPVYADMPGFVMYALVPTETGRAGMDVRETEADMEARNQLVADWAGENQADTRVGEPVVHTGVIDVADLATPGAEAFRRAKAAGRPTGRSPASGTLAATARRPRCARLRVAPRRSHAHRAPRRLAARLRPRHRQGLPSERCPVTTSIARRDE